MTLNDTELHKTFTQWNIDFHDTILYIHYGLILKKVTHHNITVSALLTGNIVKYTNYYQKNLKTILYKHRLK